MACASGYRDDRYDSDDTYMLKSIEESLKSFAEYTQKDTATHKQTDVYVQSCQYQHRQCCNTYDELCKKFNYLINHIFEIMLNLPQHKGTIVCDKKECKTSGKDITLISTIPTVGNGSCGWRSLLTIIINSIYGVYIPQHHDDFYKFIVQFKIILYNYIVLLINSQHLEISEFLSNVKIDVNYTTLDEYFTALMRYDYQLTLFELEKFVLFIGQSEYKQFKYINVLLCCIATGGNVVRSVYSTKHDDEAYDITKYPIIYLLNGHWTPVNECKLKEIPVGINIDCRLIKHK